MSAEDTKLPTPSKKPALYQILLASFAGPRARSNTTAKTISASESLTGILSQQQRLDAHNNKNGASASDASISLDPAMPAPALSGLLRSASPAQRTEILNRLAMDVQILESVDPLAIWLEAALTLADDQPSTVRLASLRLLTSCIATSIALAESASGRGGADRAVYWAAVLRFAADCQVLDLSELIGTVGAINALCRGGRDISGLEGLVPLLCTILREQAGRRQDLRRRFAEREAPSVPFGSPLMDSSFATPFVHIAPGSPEIALGSSQSSIALLTDIHKFSWGHLKPEDLDMAADVIVSYGHRTTSDLGVQLALAFIDTVAKFGFVPDAQMPNVIALVARVVGIEHSMSVLQIGASGAAIVRPLPDDLSQFARLSMRNLLLSPANQALRHLRNATGSFLLPQEQTTSPVVLVLGAVRCLRRTLTDFYQQSSAADKPLAFDMLPAIVNLGMTLLHEDVLNALEEPSPDIALEVLGILEDRFAFAPAHQSSLEGNPSMGGSSLSYDEWDMVVDILRKIASHFDSYVADEPQTFMLDLLADATELSVTGNAFGPLLVAYRAIFARTIAAFGETNWIGPVEDVCELFASLRRFLTSDSLTLLLEFYSAEALCLPSEPNWLRRVAEVVEVASSQLQVSARRRAYELLKEIFDAVRDELDLRNQVVQEHFLPFLDRALTPERLRKAYNLENQAPFIALTNAVMDDALSWADPLPANSAAESDLADPSGHAFDRLVEYLNGIASMSWVPPATAPILQSANGRHSRQTSEASGHAIAVINDHHTSEGSSYLSRIDSPNACAAHVLITAFLSALSKRTTSTSMRAVIIFRKLLRLVAPGRDGVPRKVRLFVLALLLRLRADSRHTIHVAPIIDIEGFASIIDRAGVVAVEMPNGLPAGAVEEVRRGRNRPKQPSLPSPERNTSRSASRPRQQDRSPSRSRSPSDNCWRTTDALPFAVPTDVQSGITGGLASYDSSIDWSESQSATKVSEFPDYDLALASRAPGAIVMLPVSEYLRCLCSILEQEHDWEVLSYVLCYLPDQLTNKHFAAGPRASRELHKLRALLCEAIKRDKLTSSVALPPSVKTGDVNALACQLLATLIAYRSIFAKEQQEEMVETFAHGLRRRDIAKPCIHALTVACHELSHCMPAYLHGILQNLALIITTESMAVHALEFIASVGLQPNLYRSFTDREYLAVFAISLQYITLHHRDTAEAEQSPIISNRALTRQSTALADTNGVGSHKSPQAQAFSVYVLHMAYYNLALWFMSSRVSARREYVRFITRKLVEATECRGGLDEQAEVNLDMLARYVTSNLQPTTRPTEFRKAVLSAELERRNDLPKRTWLIGHALVTYTRLEGTRWTEIAIRRPSGLVKALIEVENAGAAADDAADQDVLELVRMHREEFGDLALPFVDGMDPQTPVHRPQSARANGVPEQSPSAALDAKIRASSENYVGESFLTMQLSSYPEFGVSGPPALLPKEGPATSWYLSTIRSLDHTPVIDAHAIGVLYVGPGQTEELDIFANSMGSKAYVSMLHGLGDVVRLRGHEGYTAGLDRSEDLDGKWMIAWQNKVTQIVFHVSTLIPGNREVDQQLIGRKRHLGNDAVKIIFNDSGGPYDFRTVKGQFNWVNVVIEPHTPVGKTWSAAGMSSNEAFFKVYMQLDPSMPELGPLGAFKMVSAGSLGQVVRHLALHADIYAKVHLSEVGFETSHGQQKVEFTSNWRKRLQIIKSVQRRLAEQNLLPRTKEGELEGMTRDVTTWT